MPKFEIRYKLSGPIGTKMVPNATNPVVADNLSQLLKQLAENLPSNDILGLKTIGILVVEHEPNLS